MTIDFTKLSELSAFGKPVDLVLIKKDGEWKEIWSAVEKDIIFGASDGATVKYAIKQLSNDNVPAYTLQYSGGTNRTVQLPYQSNPHLSSSVTDKEAYISNLTYIDDKNGHILTAWPHACFRCSKLRDVNLPNVIYVDKGAFAWNGALSNINIPEVRTIIDSAFYNSTSITSLNIPRVTSIGNSVFGYCTNLKYLYLLSLDIPPTLGNDKVFNGLTKYLVLVKNETYKSYLTANYWQNISSHISSVTLPIVTFLCGDTLINEQKLNYGMSAVAPIVSRPYYDFKGWDNNYNDVSTDITCNAIFSKRFLNDDTTVLEMSNHYVTGTSADFIHTCDEINPNVSCTTDGVTRLLNNTEDYDLSYENNIVNWTNLNVGDLCSLIALVIVTGKGYYEGLVSTDFTITYFRNGADKVTVTFDPCGGDVPMDQIK